MIVNEIWESLYVTVKLLLLSYLIFCFLSYVYDGQVIHNIDDSKRY